MSPSRQQMDKLSEWNAPLPVKGRPFTAEMSIMSATPPTTSGSWMPNPSILPPRFPTLLPPGVASPYEENQRLRRELHGLKKRCQGLEAELAKPPATRTQQMKGAYRKLDGATRFLSEGEADGDAGDAGVERLIKDWEKKVHSVQSELKKAREELQRVRTETSAKMDSLKNEKQDALKLADHMKATFEGQMAQRMLHEKEGRVEMVRRQSLRRILNRRLASGWAAWSAFWSAKTYALRRLRQVANHLKSPELARAFTWWERLCADRRKAAQAAALERQAKTIEGQLRQLQLETGQLAMIKVCPFSCQTHAQHTQAHIVRQPT